MFVKSYSHYTWAARYVWNLKGGGGGGVGSQECEGMGKGLGEINTIGKNPGPCNI